MLRLFATALLLAATALPASAQVRQTSGGFCVHRDGLTEPKTKGLESTQYRNADSRPDWRTLQACYDEGGKRYGGGTEARTSFGSGQEDTGITITTGRTQASVGLNRRGLDMDEDRNTRAFTEDGAEEGSRPASNARPLVAPRTGIDGDAGPGTRRSTVAPTAQAGSGQAPRPNATRPVVRRPQAKPEAPRPQSYAANPLPVAAAATVSPPASAPAFDATLWPSDGGSAGLAVPSAWVWERGGWAWDDQTRAARLNDPTLRKTSPSTPNGWVARGGEGPAGWLPEGGIACEASQRIETALKIHRLAMTPDETHAWADAKRHACLRRLDLR